MADSPLREETKAAELLNAWMGSFGAVAMEGGLSQIEDAVKVLLREREAFQERIEALRDPFVRDALFVGDKIPRKRTVYENPPLCDELLLQLERVVYDRNPNVDWAGRSAAFVDALRTISKPPVSLPQDS